MLDNRIRVSIIGTASLGSSKAGGETDNPPLEFPGFIREMYETVLCCVLRFCCFNSFLIAMMQSTHSYQAPVAKARVDQGASGAVSVRVGERPWRRCGSSRSTSMVCC